jgi:hypothetical protein
LIAHFRKLRFRVHSFHDLRPSKPDSSIMQYSITLVAVLLSALAQAAVIPQPRAAAAGGNLQTFTGALGGIPPIPVTNSGDAKRPFAVDGTTDVNLGAALQRSCSVQHNSCANAANANKNAGFSVSDCEQQENQCNAAAKGGPAQASQGSSAPAAQSSSTQVAQGSSAQGVQCGSAPAAAQSPASTPAAAAAAAGGNFQTFTGALGGIPPIPVTNSGDAKRPFAVDGTTDVNKGAALQRSCAVQHNSCASAANANKTQDSALGTATSSRTSAMPRPRWA